MTANTANSIQSIFMSRVAPFQPPTLAQSSSTSVKTLPDKPEVPSEDFDYARSNLIDVIDTGQEALARLVDLAARSQHPRAYEVLTGLLNSLADASGKLLALQKQQKELTGEHAQPKNVNNNLFVGSTTELQKLIKQMRNDDAEH